MNSAPSFSYTFETQRVSERLYEPTTQPTVLLSL